MNELSRAEEIRRLNRELRKEKNKNKNKNKKEFSKLLLIQESILIWIVTIAFIILAFYCVVMQYFGELPWLTALAGFPWTAYGVSQAFYYNKSKSENTKDGIKFETAMAELNPSPDEEIKEDSALG